jgi:glycosyltransferase involved in cell wall biosynthesis
MKYPISITILTKNSEKYLQEVLQPLYHFEEVLVCDTGSTDQTFSIIDSYLHSNADSSSTPHPRITLAHSPFNGFGPTHNKASAMARNDWILSIDSDEVLSTELIEEIKALDLQRGCVYSIPRKNEYRGKWIRSCGWHPDRVIRLYNRLDTQFSNAQVHESILTNQVQVIHLKSYLKHYSYERVSDFLQKMQSYSTLFAIQNQGKKASSLSKAILRSGFTFFKCYFLKRGILEGREGFEISLYNALTTFYKYLKLSEANEKCGDVLTKKEAATTPHKNANSIQESLSFPSTQKEPETT